MYENEQDKIMAAFLNEMKTKFKLLYNKNNLTNKNAYSLQKFNLVLKQLMVSKILNII
jgi:hypothetical protein